jgi:UrcA family protein
MTMNHSTASRFLKSAISLMVTCLLLGTAIAAPTFADGTDSLHLRTSTVSFSDLDLSFPADVAQARERVHRVARALCAQVADPESVAHQPAYVSCVETAMAKAEPSLRKLADDAAATTDRFASR